MNLLVVGEVGQPYDLAVVLTVVHQLTQFSTMPADDRVVGL